MEITVSFKVNIDPAAWTLNYGVSGDRAIRADVKSYVEQGAREQLAHVGVLKES